MNKNRSTSKQEQDETLREICFQFGVSFENVQRLFQAEKEKRVLRRRASIAKIIEEIISKDLSDDNT